MGVLFHRGGGGRKVRAGDLYPVTLSSSSHAYAVSILPKSKMHDLQGGSSSSQKSRYAAIFGSPVFSAESNGSLKNDPFLVISTEKG